MSVEYSEKFHNYYARVYDHLFGKISNAGLNVIPRLLEMSVDDRLLEIGVGTGNSFAYLPWSTDYTGIDMSEEMLRKARKKAEESSVKKFELHKMDALNLEFEDNTFDRVLAAYVITTVPDPVRAVKELMRVCKPGGYILILNHFQSENPIIGFFNRITSPFWYRLGFKSDLCLSTLMRDTGLEIETLEDLEWNGYWKAVRCINPE